MLEGRQRGVEGGAGVRVSAPTARGTAVRCGAAFEEDWAARLAAGEQREGLPPQLLMYEPKKL